MKQEDGEVNCTWSELQEWKKKKKHTQRSNKRLLCFPVGNSRGLVAEKVVSVFKKMFLGLDFMYELLQNHCVRFLVIETQERENHMW